MGHRNWGALVLSAGLSVAANNAFAAGEWAADIELGGVVEIEARAGSDYANKDFSDIALATVSLDLDAALSERLSAHLRFLHEDNHTEPMEVDEGTIKMDYGTVIFTAGRMYVPFGVYETQLISDPLTLEIGETREATLQLGAEYRNFYGSIYVFNGSIIKAAAAANGEDTVEGIGATMGYEQKRENFALDIGFDLINNIGDSDILGEWLAINAGSQMQSHVSGKLLHALLRIGPWTVIAEYLQTDQFATGELDFGDRGAELAALNLESGYTFDWAGRESTLAMAYQMTDEAVAIGLPKARMLLGMGVLIEQSTRVKLEYATDKDYGVDHGGTGDDASTLMAQLAVEF